MASIKTPNEETPLFNGNTESKIEDYFNYIMRWINAISSATKAFIEFDRQIIRLRQVTGAGAVGIDALRKTIRALAQDLGVSIQSIIQRVLKKVEKI